MVLDGYRWTEMARAMSASSLWLFVCFPSSLDVDRKELRALRYFREGVTAGTLSQTTRQTMVLDGYRWTEMAKGYERLGLLNGSSARVNPVEAP